MKLQTDILQPVTPDKRIEKRAIDKTKTFENSPFLKSDKNNSLRQFLFYRSIRFRGVIVTRLWRQITWVIDVISSRLCWIEVFSWKNMRWFFEFDPELFFFLPLLFLPRWYVSMEMGYLIWFMLRKKEKLSKIACSQWGYWIQCIKITGESKLSSNYRDLVIRNWKNCSRRVSNWMKLSIYQKVTHSEEIERHCVI